MFRPLARVPRCLGPRRFATQLESVIAAQIDEAKAAGTFKAERVITSAQVPDSADANRFRRTASPRSMPVR